nr:unnamed protein product [Naegleria fowleri]
MTKQRSFSSSSKASSKPSLLNKQSVSNQVPFQNNDEMKENVSPQYTTNSRLENSHNRVLMKDENRIVQVYVAHRLESSALVKRKVPTTTKRRY